MTKIRMDYRDLESEMHNAANMSKIACDMLEASQSRRAGDGSIVIPADHMNVLLFAVYHTDELVRAFKAKWDEIHESNVRASRLDKGGAAKGGEA